MRIEEGGKSERFPVMGKTGIDTQVIEPVKIGLLSLSKYHPAVKTGRLPLGDSLQLRLGNFWMKKQLWNGVKTGLLSLSK